MDSLNIGSAFFDGHSRQSAGEAKWKKLSDEIKNTEKASDEELMKACKSFESYMLEQVLIKMEETAQIDGTEKKDNEYLSMFKDHFIKDTAEKMTEHTDIGIAKMLYESMKRNKGTGA